MRKDMYKIICERPRVGGRYSGDHHPYRKAKHVVLDENLECLDEFSGRTKLPIKPFGLGWDDYKSFNDYLSPLYRFIEKQVGRQWDDVYSEICENITLDSTTRRHVREHVDRHVETKIEFNEHGDPCYRNRSHGRYSVYCDGKRPVYEGDLYKDPSDGILKKAGKAKVLQIEEEERRKKYKNKSKPNRHFDANDVEFTPVYGRRKTGDLNPHGTTFKYEETGERHKRYDGRTSCWFKYYWIDVKRVRQVPDERDDRLNIITWKMEEYIDRQRVRETASKKDIKKYCLN